MVRGLTEMALFNKLFTNRKHNAHNKHQENVSDKFIAFNKDQVRVVLFRECDFRGRELLFDSSSIKKVPLPSAKKGEFIRNAHNEKYSEISNGFGYVYTKKPPDIGPLAEMVFGSVAMSFRGSYFKMHNLEHPDRLMFTQVFSRPRSTNQIRISSRSDPNNLEHSRFNDSGTSSTNSMSEHLSVHSTASDTVLVCRRHRCSTSSDVSSPTSITSSTRSFIGDSGFFTEPLSNNLISGSPSVPAVYASVNDTFPTLSLSSGSLFKKLFRRASTSLENSGQWSGPQESRLQHRSSKLGLAFVLELTSGQEDELTLFLMEHVALIEAMVWRARQVIEIACVKSQNFASLMFEMANVSSQYLVNLLSGSQLSKNLWLSLSSGCDNYNSINAFSVSFSDKSASIFSDFVNSQETEFSSLSTSFSGSGSELFNFSKFLKADPFNIKRNWFGENCVITAEKFVQDFCELLQDIDVKDTNFFMSTLLTAVLTYHLGWVNTCLPPSPNGALLHTKHPFNPLWDAFTDLYGAVGQPTKIAQTIITGTNKKDLVSKILITMTYFIRCCDLDRREPIRADLEQENQTVDMICNKTRCIPKENYKKYEDHLKEIMGPNKQFFADYQNNNYFHNKQNVPKSEDNKPLVRKPLGLSRTETCFNNLVKLADEDANHELTTAETFQENAHLSFKCSSSDHFEYPSRDEIMKKVKTLCRIPSEVQLKDTEIYTSVEHLPKSQIVEMEKQTRSCSQEVVFVLGDDEELVGLKKEINDLPLKRPSFLDLSNQLHRVNFEDGDFIENFDKTSVKPSTSWSQIAGNKNLEKPGKENITERPTSSKKFSRSQSEPPEERKLQEHKNKSKFRYSGVKFNLQQYPQILSNYMKGKNLEISNLQFGDKNLKLDELSSLSETINSKYPEIDEFYENVEALQTPSNASELEFTSDTFVLPSSVKQEPLQETQSNTEEKGGRSEKEEPKTEDDNNLMKVTHLPMPKSEFRKPLVPSVGYTSSLMRAPSETYIPDMVLQGPVIPKQDWESQLKSDLALASQHSFIDQPVEEAVAVIANIDTWEVQLMSSHTFIIDKGSSGIRIGMSQLVANMLESLLQMWKLKVPPHFCLIHIEQTLQELCVRSKALAELLLATEFCNMEQLTSTLHLEVNDVPLLLAVASTHSPQVTQKYGLSFQ